MFFHLNQKPHTFELLKLSCRVSFTSRSKVWDAFLNALILFELLLNGAYALAIDVEANAMWTWHLFTNNQTVLLQTQCLIIELVDQFLKHAWLQSVTYFLHESLNSYVGALIQVPNPDTTLRNSFQDVGQCYKQYDCKYGYGKHTRKWIEDSRC